MNLYAYCLSDDIAAEAVLTMRGIGGAEVQLLSDAGLIAVVSRYAPRAVDLSRNNVFAHERVNRKVLVHSTPLPFRFGAVVSELDLNEYIEKHRATLLNQLAHVRGCVEMSIKILERRATAGTEPPNIDDAAAKSSIANQIIKSVGLGPGARFLAAKLQAIEREELDKRWADEVGAWLRERLGGHVRQSHTGLRPGSRWLFAAAHLVDRARLDEYAARVLAVRREREELLFLTSGPWPPYSFTNLSC